MNNLIKIQDYILNPGDLLIYRPLIGSRDIEYILVLDLPGSQYTICYSFQKKQRERIRTGWLRTKTINSRDFILEINNDRRV